MYITENILSVSDYSFPYIVIILSVISNAVHFAFKLDQVSTDNRNNLLFYLLQTTVFM